MSWFVLLCVVVRYRLTSFRINSLGHKIICLLRSWWNNPEMGVFFHDIPRMSIILRWHPFLLKCPFGYLRRVMYMYVQEFSLQSNLLITIFSKRGCNVGIILIQTWYIWYLVCNVIVELSNSFKYGSKKATLHILHWFQICVWWSN